jgi:hypothetical protein
MVDDLYFFGFLKQIQGAPLQLPQYVDALDRPDVTKEALWKRRGMVSLANIKWGLLPVEAKIMSDREAEYHMCATPDTADRELGAFRRDRAAHGFRGVPTLHIYRGNCRYIER